MDKALALMAVFYILLNILSIFYLIQKKFGNDKILFWTLYIAALREVAGQESYHFVIIICDLPNQPP